MFMILVEVVVLLFPFPIPHRPQRTPGTLKSRKPRHALIQPNPFVFSFVLVSVTALPITFGLPHLGQFIFVMTFLKLFLGLSL